MQSSNNISIIIIDNKNIDLAFYIYISVKNSYRYSKNCHCYKDSEKKQDLSKKYIKENLVYTDLYKIVNRLIAFYISSIATIIELLSKNWI